MREDIGQQREGVALMTGDGGKASKGTAGTMVSWIAPGLFAILLGTGFAIRGSDHPHWALLLSALSAVFAGVVWLLPTKETPAVSQRTGVKVLAGLFVALIISVSLLPLGSLMSGVSGGLGGAFDPSSFWSELIKLFGLACAFAAALRMSSNDEAARRLVDAILAVGGLWAIASVCMQIMDPNGVYGVQKMTVGRLTGAFSSANSAATLFGSLGVLAFARLLGRLGGTSSRHIIERIDPFYAVVFLFCMSALVMTLSRGGISATVVALIALCIILLWKRLSVVGWLSMLAIAAATAAVIFASPLMATLDRLDNVHDDTEVRQTIFKAHIDVAMHKPVLGTGLGSFTAVNNAIVTELNYRDLSIIGAAHNVYVQWFEETGVAGVAAIVTINLLVLGAIVVAGRKRARMGERLWGIACAYGVLLMHGLTDYAFQEPAIALYAASILGAGFAISGSSSRHAG